MLDMNDFKAVRGTKATPRPWAGAPSLQGLRCVNGVARAVWIYGHQFYVARRVAHVAEVSAALLQKADMRPQIHEHIRRVIDAENGAYLC